MVKLAVFNNKNYPKNYLIFFMNIQTTATGSKIIFISRDIKEESELMALLKKSGHQVHAESLIHIDQVRYSYTPQTDWIFFSSKNAIRYFFAQQPDLKDTVKFGVMSPSSAKYLLRHEKTASFIGEGVDVTAIAKQFAAFVKDETVLFPQALDSLQSIQKQLSFTNNCFNLFVYKTTLRTDFIIPEADLLVFTSPSNVRAYFETYKFNSYQLIIAIGMATAGELKNYGIKDPAIPEAFTEKGLLDAICKQLDIIGQ